MIYLPQVRTRRLVGLLASDRVILPAQVPGRIGMNRLLPFESRRTLLQEPWTLMEEWDRNPDGFGEP